MDRSALTRAVKQLALDAGFDAVGVARAGALPPRLLLPWLERGFHGEMHYLARDPERRLDPERVLPGAKSVLSMRLHYDPGSDDVDDPSRGIIARYARGDDYHEVLKPRLHALVEKLRALVPGVEAKAYVDTGPVLEKSWAQAAGLGWIGKHTNLIAGKAGSWFLLAEVLLTLELDPDLPVADHCGSCTRCIDACPTRAIVAPYLLDATLCISYLTIELKSDIPVELRPHLGNRVFGCDICQEVCPWNRAPAVCGEPRLQPKPLDDRLVSLAGLSPDEFSRVFRGSPVKRAKRRGLLRSVALALASWGIPGAEKALDRLAEDSDPQVARHARWALGERSL